MVRGGKVDKTTLHNTKMCYGGFHGERIASMYGTIL